MTSEEAKRKVLEAIAECAEQQGRRPTRIEIAMRVGVDQRITDRALRWLEHEGLIRLDERRRPVLVVQQAESQSADSEVVE